MAQFNLGRVKGDKGDIGKSFRLKGAWATGIEYINSDTTIDVVNHNGCAYACKITHTSSNETAPPSETSWELLLSNEFDIVHTDTINDTTKVPSTAVTYALGKEIDTINNKFAEGTWTPVILGSTFAGTNVYSTQVGFYAKIGNTVICWFTIAIQTKDPNMQGTVLMGGIPFQADPNNAGSLSQMVGVTLDTGKTHVGFRVADAFATFYTLGSNVAPLPIDATKISNGLYLRGTIVYKLK